MYLRRYAPERAFQKQYVLIQKPLQTVSWYEDTVWHICLWQEFPHKEIGGKDIDNICIAHSNR